MNLEPQYYVDADNRGGARLATEHLVTIGRTRVATITGRMDEASRRVLSAGAGLGQ